MHSERLKNKPVNIFSTIIFPSDVKIMAELGTGILTSLSSENGGLNQNCIATGCLSGLYTFLYPLSRSAAVKSSN
jgi:hypothetical protein